MSLSHISTTLENNSSGLSDASTVSYIAAISGDYILSIVSWRDNAGYIWGWASYGYAATTQFNDSLFEISAANIYGVS